MTGRHRAPEEPVYGSDEDADGPDRQAFGTVASREDAGEDQLAKDEF